MNIYYYKKIKIDIIDFWKNIIVMSLKLIIPIILILLLMIFLNSYNFIILISLIILYCLMFAIVCYFLVMNEYEKNIINSIFNSCKGIIKR